MTITIKDLRERIKDLPDGMPVMLIDVNDDDEDGGGSYNIEKSAIGVDTLTRTSNGKKVKCFTISFANKHLPSLQ